MRLIAEIKIAYEKVFLPEYYFKLDYKNSNYCDSVPCNVSSCTVMHTRDILESTSSKAHPVLKEVNHLCSEGSIAVGCIMNVLLWKIVTVLYCTLFCFQEILMAVENIVSCIDLVYKSMVTCNKVVAEDEYYWYVLGSCSTSLPWWAFITNLDSCKV